MRSINYFVVDSFFKNNPDGTYGDFREHHPKFSISDAMFYARRIKLKGGSYKKQGKKKEYSHRRVPKIYTMVWSYAMNDSSVIQDFVLSLNKAFNLRLEVVVLNEPHMVEVRRITK